LKINSYLKYPVPAASGIIHNRETESPALTINDEAETLSMQHSLTGVQHEDPGGSSVDSITEQKPLNLIFP
jgi:hypothetical protein